MIYILARALPRVNQTVSEGLKKDYFEEFFKKLPLEKADAFLSFWLERGLRSLKIAVLKLDNLLTKHLQNFRNNSQNKNAGLFSSVQNNTSSDSEKNQRVENK